MWLLTPRHDARSSLDAPCLRRCSCYLTETATKCSEVNQSTGRTEEEAPGPVCRSPAMSISQERLTCDWTAGLRLCGTTHDSATPYRLKPGKGINGKGERAEAAKWELKWTAT